MGRENKLVINSFKINLKGRIITMENKIIVSFAQKQKNYADNK